MPELDPHALTGILLPVTTPFDPVTDEIMPVGFRENLRRWLEQPVDGIVVFGSTGEGALLDDEERVRLLGFARDLVPPTRALVAGAGGDSTRGVARQCRLLAEAGADALLVYPPPYFGAGLTPAGLRDHYLAVADASPAPVIVYHIPKYTHVVLEAGLVGELSRHQNIVGLKDSAGDMRRFGEYADVCRAGFRLLVGSGAGLYTALELGAAGGIVALGLLAPEGCARILHHYREGESRQAGEIQERLAPVHREVVARLGPAGVKAALDMLGFTGGVPRPPLHTLGEKERREVGRVLRGAGLL